MPNVDTTTPPPLDPVRAALDDPGLRARLRAHAACLLDRWLADQPRTRRDQEADEIVNESLARAWTRRAAFDPALGDAAGWVHGFVFRVMAEACEKLRKLPSQGIPDATELTVDPDEFDDEPEFDPFALLDHLPGDDRIAVEGFFRLGWSHRQIADRLGIREGTARQRVNRALIKLRQIAGEVTR